MNEKVGDPWRQMVENRLFNLQGQLPCKLMWTTYSKIKSLIENVLINKLAEIIPEMIIIETACSEIEVLIAFAALSKCYSMSRPSIIQSNFPQVQVSQVINSFGVVIVKFV